jgi:FeS assembly SUF system protein
MMELEEKRQLERSIVNALKTVYDPEIPVDIYELGLIYEIKIPENREVTIVMTLTSPSCPVAESLPIEVEEKVAGVEGVAKASIDLTWEPPWDKDMMSEEALVELGLI